TCQQPNGWVWSTEYRYSALYGGQEKYDVKTCRACAANEGNQGGWCVKCPPGFNQDPATGQCSKPVVCPSGSIIKPDNSGCYACPAGSVFAADGSGCTPDCSAQPWTKLEKGYSAAPAGYYAGGFGSVPPWSGGVCACPKGQYNDGKGCVTKLECPAYQRADEKTGTCVNYCTGANMHYVDTSPPSCVPCAAGMTSVDNTCVPLCAEGAIRTGDSCQACPAGTQASDNSNAAGESTTCSPVCRPGSTYVTPPPAATDGTPTTLASGGLTLSHAGAAAAPGAGAALQGNASASGATVAAANNTKGVSGALGANAHTGIQQGGAGANNAGSARNDYCQPCAANQRYITTVSMTSGGGSITQGTCQTCPTGMVASRDHKSCVYTFTGVFSVPRTASRPVPPTTRANTSAPEPQRPTPPRERAQTPERPAPRQALRCPPGRSPNASGTACIVDLDDSGTAPGRANTPSGGGGATYRR
ncbi:MAG: hypothetical protein LCH39_11925, partial [Proteobacteria bacterium]|nr:hypothetical protein [Pseudomonadota bacterium]